MIGAKVKGKRNKEVGEIQAFYPNETVDVFWESRKSFRKTTISIKSLVFLTKPRYQVWLRFPYGALYSKSLPLAGFKTEEEAIAYAKDKAKKEVKTNITYSVACALPY